MQHLHKIRTLGRLEKVSFPELGLSNLEGKIDTGAYTTTLHCHDVKVIMVNNNPILVVKLLDPSHQHFSGDEKQFTEFKIKTFRNSFGEQEERYVIKTLVTIGRKKVHAQVSLKCRVNMRFPVLVGRKLLKNRFIIDVSKMYLFL